MGALSRWRCSLEHAGDCASHWWMMILSQESETAARPLLGLFHSCAVCGGSVWIGALMYKKRVPRDRVP